MDCFAGIAAAQNLMVYQQLHAKTDATIEAYQSAVSTSVNNMSDKQHQDSEALHRTIYGSAVGGEEGSIQPLRFCHWVAPQITSVGYTEWELAKQAFQLAIAALAAETQASINEKKIDLADKWYSHAQEKWMRFMVGYMPLEMNLVAQVTADPIKEMDCADDEARASNATDTAFAIANDYMAATARHYRRNTSCTGFDPSHTALMEVRRGMTHVDTANYNLIDDRWFCDYRNDRRWNRRSNVLNLGRNLSSYALKYGDLSRSLLDSVSRKIDTAAGAFVKAAGYYSERLATTAPTTFVGISSTTPRFGEASPPTGDGWTPLGGGLYERKLAS